MKKVMSASEDVILNTMRRFIHWQCKCPKLKMLGRIDKVTLRQSQLRISCISCMTEGTLVKDTRITTFTLTLSIGDIAKIEVKDGECWVHLNEEKEHAVHIYQNPLSSTEIITLSA